MSDSGPETIPIFPLQSVVLYPTISVPLYIFEPRYREMTRDALASERRIGMVVVRPEHAEDMAGDPPVFAVGCEGAISHAEERPDGTWNLLLTATRRFRVVEELPSEDRQYRAARVEGIGEQPGDPGELAALRAEIRTRLEDLLARAAGGEEEPPSLDRLGELDDERFVNVLAQALDFGVLEKQQLLEAAGHHARAATLRDLLHFRLVEIGAANAPGRDRLQ